MVFKKILVALELSPADSPILETAIDLGLTQRASLLLIHCLSDITEMAMLPQSGMGTGTGLVGGVMGTGMSPVAANLEVIEEANKTRDRQAQESLKEYSQQVKAQGVKVSFECYASLGDTGSQICDAARESKADLILMGRKGHSGLTEALMGSASNYVLHHAPCSVLVVQKQ